MDAPEFVRVMVPCHVLRLKRQRDIAKRMKTEGLDDVAELGKYLGLGSTRQLKSQDGNSKISKL